MTMEIITKKIESHFVILPKILLSIKKKKLLTLHTKKKGEDYDTGKKRLTLINKNCDSGNNK